VFLKGVNQMTTLEALALLNPAQRAALRRRFGGLSIAAFSKMDELFTGKFHFCVTFKLKSDKLVQYQGHVGPRGGLQYVECMGQVPASV
jgi:hypothetical protein